MASQLSEIPRGERGWKKRRQELQILTLMARATTPQTGWHIWQKMRRSGTERGFSGDDICMLMVGLAESGHLRIVGSDPDCGHKYEVVGESELVRFAFDHDDELMEEFFPSIRKESFDEFYMSEFYMSKPICRIQAALSMGGSVSLVIPTHKYLDWVDTVLEEESQ